MVEAEHKINSLIRAHEVRLVGDNVEPGVYSIGDALRLSDELELDLVEISPNAEPPVCKIIDYKKFLYEQKKKKKEQKANTVKQEVKEIRFGPNTDEHDFDFKVKHAEKFLNDGDKVRAFVLFKGRSIVYKERGELLLLQFAQKLQDIGKVEQLPKLEGKKMFLMMSPKGKAGK
ncbi:MAG: translation initiation factor IF-3 [Bacteroidota bacterium]